MYAYINAVFINVHQSSFVLSTVQLVDSHPGSEPQVRFIYRFTGLFLVYLYIYIYLIVLACLFVNLSLYIQVLSLCVCMTL